MNKSESIKNIAAALGIFREKMVPVKKDSDNPFYHSKYASLDTILIAIDEPLSVAGLSFVQFPDGNGLTTILMHADSGEWIECGFTIPLAKNDPQGAGSALTYMRRYALGAILGLATESDDDGNVASTPKLSKVTGKAPTPIVERTDEPFPSKQDQETLEANVGDSLSDIKWD